LGGGAYWAYFNYYQTPANLYAWAEKAYRKADEATDTAEKKKQLEYADGYLMKMLEKEPKSSKGWFLRYLVHNKLLDIARAQEQDSGDTDHVNSMDHTQKRDEALFNAVQLDKNNVEAVATAQDARFAADDIPSAEPYSEILVSYEPEKYNQLPKSDVWLAAAHYVLARQALTGRPPRPDEALEHLNAIKAIKSPNPPRWREIYLETEALMAKADKIRKAAPGGAADKKNEAQELLDKQVPLWVERASKELAERDIPGTDDNNPPKPFILYKVNPTNIRGHLQFLVLAIELAPSANDIVDRVKLLLATDEKMLSYPRVEEKTVRAVGLTVSALPTLLERQPHAKELRPEQWTALNKGIKKLSDMALKVGAPIAPAAYLQLAMKAKAEQRFDDAYKLISDGLKAAEAIKLPANASDQAKKQQQELLVELHSQAAWLLLLQKKTAEAQGHLSFLRHTRATAAFADLIDGMVAVRDGRFEEGAQFLQSARQDAKIAEGVFSKVYLAVAYMSLGQFANARPLLLALEERLKSQKLSDEEQRVAGDLLQDPDAVRLQLMRCYLGLYQPELALPYKEALQNKPEGMAIRILFIDYYTRLGRLNLAQGDSLNARDAFDAAEKELKQAFELQPDDPSLVWAKAMLVASRPETNKALAAEAEAAIKAAGSDTAKQAAARALLEKANHWNLELAEKVLADYDKRKNDLASSLLWYNWLLVRNRLNEANDLLNRLEEKYPDSKKQLHLVHAQLTLYRQSPAEAGKLVETLKKEGADVEADALAVLNFVLNKKDNAAARKVLDALVSKQEANLQYQDWKAKLAFNEGDYAEAARAFGRCLGYSKYSAEAEQLVGISLLALAAQKSPQEAQALAEKLLGDHPRSPALMYASAGLAGQLDNIDGADGMVARLKKYEELLVGRPGASPANGADRLARGLRGAGRPDLARREVERALKLDPNYAPALLLAIELAAAEEDWNDCLNASTALIALLQQRQASRDRATPRYALDLPDPTLSEAMGWRARALEELGRTEDARHLLQDVIIQNPQVSTGYLGLARLLENLKDYKGALKLVRQWRERDPHDPTGMQAELKMLVLAERTKEADRVADKYFADEMRRFEKELADSTAKRAVPKERQLVINECVLRAMIGRAFLDAKSLESAASWARQSLTAAERLSAGVADDKLPADAKIARTNARILLGDVAHRLSEQKQGKEKAAAVAEAVKNYQIAWDLTQNKIAGNNLAYLLCKHSPEKAPTALGIVEQIRKTRYSDRAISGDRLDLEILATLGEVYLITDPRAAITLLKEALARYKNEPMVYSYLGQAYDKLKKPDKKQAEENMNLAILAAVAKAKTAKNQELKDKWNAKAEEARGILKEIKGAKQ
jgi:tetratricopeptide (TPR) repeat protein